MANGDILTLDRDRFEIVLLDGQSASSTGAWVEVPAHLNLWAVTTTSLEEGASDATVDIHASNAATKPLDATAGEVIWQALVLATTGAAKQGGYKYVKAVKTAGTTPVATTVRFRATPSR